MVLYIYIYIYYISWSSRYIFIYIYCRTQSVFTKQYTIIISFRSLCSTTCNHNNMYIFYTRVRCVCIAALYINLSRADANINDFYASVGALYIHIIIINIKLCVCGAMGTKKEDCMLKNPRG